MNSILEQAAKWRDANPLRMWRRANNMPLVTLSGLVGVNVSSLSRLESGASRPADATLESLARVMESDPAELRKQWDNWMEERP